jgi:hypothetical protein
MVTHVYYVICYTEARVTATIEFADKSTEKYDTKKIYKAWRRITSAISKSLEKLLAKPEETTQNTIDATEQGTHLWSSSHAPQKNGSSHSITNAYPPLEITKA